MRTFAQDAAFYRKGRVEGTDDPEALRRLKELEAIDAIRQRFTLAEALSALGVGRSMYYERRRRLREEGVRDLVPRSSRPKSHPRASSGAMRTFPAHGISRRTSSTRLASAFVHCRPSGVRGAH